MNIPSITKETTDQASVEEVTVEETTVQTADDVVTAVDTGEQPDQPKQQVEGAFSDADRIPANWTITPTEEGIEAFNSNTGSRFSGPISDFNAKLRG